MAEVSGEFEIQIYQVVAGGEDILLASQDVTLTDDDGSSDAPASSLIGSSTANNFFFGGSNPLSSEGGSDNDAYVISRYQTDDVDLTDGFQLNTIKFDYGVEIVSAVRTGFLGSGDAAVTLGTGAIVSWANPTTATNWQYQIGDSDVLLSWTKFLEKLGLSGDGGTLTTPYRVTSLAASDSETGGNVALQLSGGEADEVFAFGNDGRLDGVGGAGDDIYIITRYQSDDVTLDDRSGTNIIKLDYGVEVSSVRASRGAGGELRLGTDATVTWANPANWQYQIGDGKVLSWSKFLAELGPTNDDEELVNAYNVGVLDITSNAEIIIFLQEGRDFVDTGAAIYTATNIANKHPLEITWSLAGDDAALFNIDEGSGAVTFERSIPPATHVHVDAKYEFTIVATAGTQQAIKNVTIDVVDTNEAPIITTETTNDNNKLVLSVYDDQNEVTTIAAMDADGDTLTFSISGGADKDFFKVGASGELAFYDEPNFENPEDADGNNKYEVTVRVTDGYCDASGSSSDADIRYFKYTGGELSKAEGPVSITAGTITKANDTMLHFAAKTGLSKTDGVYIIVDDADNNDTYEVRQVMELPTDDDDYYTLGQIDGGSLTPSLCGDEIEITVNVLDIA